MEHHSGNIFYFSRKITLNKSRLTLLQLLILFSCFKKFFFKLKKKKKKKTFVFLQFCLGKFHQLYRINEKFKTNIWRQLLWKSSVLGKTQWICYSLNIYILLQGNLICNKCNQGKSYVLMLCIMILRMEHRVVCKKAKINNSKSKTNKRN